MSVRNLMPVRGPTENEKISEEDAADLRRYAEILELYEEGRVSTNLVYTPPLPGQKEEPVRAAASPLKRADKEQIINDDMSPELSVQRTPSYVRDTRSKRMLTGEIMAKRSSSPGWPSGSSSSGPYPTSSPESFSGWSDPSLSSSLESTSGLPPSSHEAMEVDDDDCGLEVIWECIRQDEDDDFEPEVVFEDLYIPGDPSFVEIVYDGPKPKD